MRDSTSCSFSNDEGRDSAASLDITRQLVFGPAGAALLLVLVAVLSAAAVALIAGAAP